MEPLLASIAYWHWFALALILGILDVVLGANFFFVWCGLSALIVGVCLIIVPHMSWEFQFLIFGACALVSLLFWRSYLAKHGSSKTDIPFLNRRAEQYLGRVFTLEGAIVNGSGKVRVEDSIWRVQGPDLPSGTKVRVIDVDGVVLKVEKLTS